MLKIGEAKELVKDNVKVVFENIGEGYHGDYDETDLEDKNLLRFSVYVNDETGWIPVDDASYCTLVSADISEEKMTDLLNVLMNEFYNVLHKNIYASVKKLGERMSWISEEEEYSLDLE